MNHYSYRDLTIGMEERFSVRICEEMMEKFREISNDSNPLHAEREFAVQKGYPDRVVYGMLTASFLSTVGGVYLPGENCLIHSVEIKFLHPVYVGDELRIRAVVDELHDSVRQVVLKIEIKNQKNEKVLRGKMKVGVLNEGD